MIPRSLQLALSTSLSAIHLEEYFEKKITQTLYAVEQGRQAEFATKQSDHNKQNLTRLSLVMTAWIKVVWDITHFTFGNHDIYFLNEQPTVEVLWVPQWLYKLAVSFTDC